MEFSQNQEEKNKIIFTKEEASNLSQIRIIQKKLVHFQNFPENLYNKQILSSYQYFGQYGKITKITLMQKTDSKTNKLLNSAYIAFDSKIQAAYCILAVDSIKINGELVRAFFGTTKYCNHFLNNEECPCEEKCIFLHNIANKKNIIGDEKKFGYSDHIKLAKKIVTFGSLKSKKYVEKNKSTISTILPNMVSIYSKEYIMMKTINHRESNLNFYLSNLGNLSNKVVNKESTNFISSHFINNYKSNLYLKSKKRSRFFDVRVNNKNNVNYLIDSKFDIYNTIIDYIINNFYLRSSEKTEYDFCLQLYEQTKNIEIIKLIKRIYSN